MWVCLAEEIQWLMWAFLKSSTSPFVRQPVTGGLVNPIAKTTVLFPITNHAQNHYKWTTIIIPNHMIDLCWVYQHKLSRATVRDMSKPWHVHPIFGKDEDPKSGALRPAPLVSTW